MSHSRVRKAEVVSEFRRAQLLEAARESFGQLGLAGTTVDDIARRAGVAKGTVYLYFKSKADILEHAMLVDHTRLRDETVPLITGDGPLVDRLTAFLAAGLVFVDQNRGFFEHVHFEMGRDMRKRTLQQLERIFHDQVHAWRTALTRARRRGEVGRDLSPAAAAQTIVALASGLAKQRIRGWLPGPVDRIAATTSATIWRGLAAR
ncbi:MAG: hypothetical protein ABS36_14355 [Acidobacteria bacterium SCN 69-37]|nr:MAG: hypothetical protein ABS36_14355 [Acidobacteria bacterium SCN 69-37]